MTTHDIPILAEGSVAELEQALRGRLVRPSDADYDQVRAIWNGAHDHHPALIVRCAGVADVIRAVEFARSEELTIAVRSGGHSIPGYSSIDNGIVIDLSQMQGIQVDPQRRVARVQPGVTWAALDHETQAFGLAVTGGLVSSTGVAGLTLGGGIGWLMRKHGLSADNLIAADVVTADGRLVRASEGENPELLWGLRGGGGNFGIVTSLEFRLHAVGPMVTGGAVFYPAELAGDVLRFYRDWIDTAPDELTTLVNLLTCPPAPFLPQEWHGRALVAVVGMHVGPADEGEAALRPLRELGTPVADLFGPMPYVAMQSLIDPLWGPGAYSYMKAGFIRELDDDAIETLVAQHASVTSPKTEIHLQHLGGAVGRVARNATAFPERDAPLVLNIVASTFTADGYDDAVAWAQETYAELSPVLTGGAYVNFLSSEGDERVRAAYGPETYDRLVALKDEYDPENVFHLNQNINPS